MTNKISIAATLILLTLSTLTFATDTDSVLVDVNLDVIHSVGGISTFDRSKFVTIHSEPADNEWTSGNNAVNDFRNDFLNGYDVYLGRNTGGITWWLNARVTEDQNRPGFADSTSIKQLGQNAKDSYALKTTIHPYEKRDQQIICAQLHPFWPDGQTTQNGWAFSQTDTDAEPFGTATGEYMGRFIRDFYGTGGSTGAPRPNLVEVVNEPLWDLVTNGNEEPEKIFRFHNHVADEIKKLNDSILVGGYCAAFPDLEKDNFQRWEERWKLFMDLSGEHMDFWSLHLYDFPAFGGKQQYRKGAQMEATLDMMEQYSYLKFGKAKPFLVSEFGAQTHDYNNIWSPYRDWLHMKSANAMMLQFMARPQLVTKLINYIMLKAEWGYNSSTGQTWGSRLMRKANEPESYTGDWVYSDMVKMFQLWADVKGTRVDSKSNNIDILCDSYVNGNNVYVIANNLDLEKSKILGLNLLGTSENALSLKVRQHLLVGQQSEMVENEFTSIPKTIEIAPEGTVILEYTFAEPIESANSSNEIKYYATEYYKPIIGKQTLFFDINNVETGQFGEATLRLGIGRDLNYQRFPEVKINGTTLNYEQNYRGDNQQDRQSFFGVLEIDVPYNLLHKNNNISIKFPESGGFVSSVAMQVYTFSREIKRFQNPITGIAITNKSDIKLLPNPAHKELRISFSTNEQPESVEIYSLDGKKLLHVNDITSNGVINIEQLNDGIYLLKIKTREKYYNQKLVVKK